MPIFDKCKTTYWSIPFDLETRHGCLQVSGPTFRRCLPAVPTRAHPNGTSRHPGKNISHVAGKTISCKVTRCLCPLCPRLTWVKKYADRRRSHHPTSSYPSGAHPSTSSARRLPHQPRNSSRMGFNARK